SHTSLHTHTNTHKHTHTGDALPTNRNPFCYKMAIHNTQSVKTHTPSTIIDDQLQGTTEKSGTITITIKDTHILESHTRTHTHRDTHLTVLPSTHITIK